MAETAAASSDPRLARLAGFLRQRVRARDGDCYYFKSKFIADEVELSPKEIGALLPELRETVDDLDVERWGYTNATTWQVTMGDDAT